MTKYITHAEITAHILREKESGSSLYELARKYGVPLSTINHVLHGAPTFKLSHEMVALFNVEPRPYFKIRSNGRTAR
jgi:hypothetical protein